MARTPKKLGTSSSMIDVALARRQLQALIRKAQAISGLAKRVSAARWTVYVSLLGPKAMAALNAQYRGKDYATDVLSFDAPAVFRAQGHLGELVICGAVLRRQAREHGHAPADELRVLLAHGLLHLLGLDHELGPREARAMAQWEAVLLPQRLQAGLIGRAG